MSRTDTTRPETHHHLAQVARGGALGLVGAAISAAASFLLVLVVTNHFSSDVAGKFFTATSVSLLLTAMATLGTETGLGRFMLRYEAHDRRGDIPPTIRAAFRPTLGFSVVLGVGVFAFAGPLSETVGLGGSEGANSLRILAVLLPVTSWNALTLAGTRAFGRMRTTVVVDKVVRPLAQPLLALGVSLSGAGLLLLTASWAIPYVGAALVSGLLFRRFLHRRVTFTHTEPTVSYRQLRRDFWSFTWPRSITRVAQMAIQRLDIILIAAMRSPTEAAIYTAATRFVALGQFGTQAIQQVLQPKFTALVASEDHESLRDVYKVSAAWSMSIAWPIYVSIGCAPVAYLSLFGGSYVSSGVPVVLMMAAAMLFSVATGPADTLLLMSGRSQLSLGNSMLALVLDVGLCLLLIPHMGITGAGLAWAVASSARCLASVIQVRRTLDLVSFGRPAAVVVLANLVFAIPVVVVGRLVHLGFPMLVLLCVVLFPVYLGVLWLGRGPLELTVLSALFRRRHPAPDPAETDAGRRDADG